MKKHLVRCLLIEGTDSFHCGLTFNELADRAAKQGAIYKTQSELLDVPLSSQEMYYIIENDM